MKTSFHLTALRSLEKKLAEYPAQMEAAVESAVRMTATTLCSEYARATGPGKTLADAPVIKYE